MKKDLEFNFDIYGHEKQNEGQRFGIFLIIKKLLESLFIISLSFSFLSVFVLSFLLYYKKQRESISILKDIKNYFLFIKCSIFNPFNEFKIDSENSKIFSLTSIYSLLLTSFINRNSAFFGGFSKGVETTRKSLIIKQKDYLLEKKFIKDELVKSLEDIQNKLVKIQYDFFDFVKSNERLNNNFQYEVEKSNVNPDFDQMKKKIDLLESSLGKINENIFDLGINMSRNNYNWRFPRKRISYSGRDFENKEKSENQ